MELECYEGKLVFHKTQLVFENRNIENLFSLKNNKSLGETIKHKKYKRFEEAIIEQYTKCLEMPLGNFLFSLKSEGDEFYSSFLNKYGDDKYCNFYIFDQKVLTKRGIYIYMKNDKIMYIGRCLDNFKKRINYGYGQIHPKNCYIDGQSTNCHLNSIINDDYNNIDFSICFLEHSEQISDIEKELISLYNPEWNTVLKKNAYKSCGTEDVACFGGSLSSRI